MLSRRLRYWLAAALLLGAGGCELNPQPGLPGRDPSGPALGEGAANAGGSKTETPGVSGALNLGGSAPSGAAGTSNDSGNLGGAGAEPTDPGAGGDGASGEGGDGAEAGQGAGGAPP